MRLRSRPPLFRTKFTYRVESAPIRMKVACSHSEYIPMMTQRVAEPYRSKCLKDTALIFFIKKSILRFSLWHLTPAPSKQAIFGFNKNNKYFSIISLAFDGRAKLTLHFFDQKLLSDEKFPGYPPGKIIIFYVKRAVNFGSRKFECSRTLRDFIGERS